MNGFDDLKKGHTGTVNSVILSDDGNFLISLGEDFVVFWDAVKGIALKTVSTEDFNLIREGRLLLSSLQSSVINVH